MNSRAVLRGFGLAVLATWVFGGAVYYYVHFTGLVVGARNNPLQTIIQWWRG